MKKEGLTRQAYKTIKKMIITNQLAPGQFVNEAQMQEHLGLGRTPVREAFLALSRDQLVTIHPRRGIEISPISPKKIHDLFEIRAIIEPDILYKTMEQLDPEWLISMRSAFLATTSDDSDILSTQEGIMNCVQLDDEFHQKLVTSLGNKYADSLMDSFFDYLMMIRIAVTSSAQRYKESNLEHVGIIDAILQGDHKGACEKLKEHIETSYTATIQNYVNSNL